MLEQRLNEKINGFRPQKNTKFTRLFIMTLSFVPFNCSLLFVLFFICLFWFMHDYLSVFQFHCLYCHCSNSQMELMCVSNWGKYLVLVVVVVVITERTNIFQLTRCMNSLSDEVMHTNIQQSCLLDVYLALFPSRVFRSARAKADMKWKHQQNARCTIYCKTLTQFCWLVVWKKEWDGLNVCECLCLFFIRITTLHDIY